MRYQAIEGKIWFDDRFCSLTPMQQRLFFYLLTCPHGNWLGIFVLKPAYAQADLSYKTQSEYMKDLNGICKTEMVFYDKENNVLWVKNLIKYGYTKGWSAQHKKGAEKTLSELPFNTLLKPFAEYYKALLDGVSIPHCKPLPVPYGEPEPEPEPEPEDVATERGLRLSEFLFSFIQKRNNGHKPPDLNKWAKEIDRMIKIDGRDPPEIERVIEWCQGDEFWMNNVLSPVKLRKHYDQLKLKMNTLVPPKKPDALKLKCHKEWVPPK